MNPIRDTNPESTPLNEENEDRLLDLTIEASEITEAELVEGPPPLHLDHQHPPRPIQPRLETDEEHNVALALAADARFAKDSANFEYDMAGKSISVVATEAANHGIGVHAAMDVLDGSVRDLPWSKDPANPLNRSVEGLRVLPLGRDPRHEAEFEAFTLLEDDRQGPDPIQAYQQDLEDLRTEEGLMALVERWPEVAEMTAGKLGLGLAFLPNAVIFHTKEITETRARDLALHQLAWGTL